MVKGLNSITRTMHHIRRIHFVDIGDAGMCGATEVPLDLDYKVPGPGPRASTVTERLEKFSARILINHQAENADGTDVLMVSSAIGRASPEVASTPERRIPVMPCVEILTELMCYRHGVVIVGTHSKTTTTSLIALVFTAGDLDSIFIIDDRLNAVGTNA